MISRKHYKFDNLIVDPHAKIFANGVSASVFPRGKKGWQSVRVRARRAADLHDVKQEKEASKFEAHSRDWTCSYCRRDCSQSYSTSRYSVRAFSTVLRPDVCDTATEYRLLILPWRFLFRPRISRFQNKKKTRRENTYIRAEGGRG